MTHPPYENDPDDATTASQPPAAGRRGHPGASPRRRWRQGAALTAAVAVAARAATPATSTATAGVGTKAVALPGGAALTPAEIYRRASPGVVSITSTRT